jgi:hypothetical protein
MKNKPNNKPPTPAEKKGKERRRRRLFLFSLSNGVVVVVFNKENGQITGSWKRWKERAGYVTTE